jgi:glycine/D-amino acid oxidase-like deaminating enzyme
MPVPLLHIETSPALPPAADVVVIGELAGMPGLILAAGFSGHGFGIGPGAGHIIADIVTGAPGLVAFRHYDPARLSSDAWGKVADF